MPDATYPTPATRRLRVYAFDPAASVSLDTAVINNAVIELPWEKDWEGDLEPGPANDYLEVVDFDPGCDCFYEPVDVNHPSLLAQDGLPPSEGNPQFHQQMVFAVAMKTVRNFERALGRPVFWSLPGADPRKGGEHRPHFTKRLRIYPHAMQDRNAYFSPGKGALLFGYFRGQSRFAGHDGDWVFTCLSQDIIAHETTHAILHGMRRRNIEAANPDSLAFHEGFADIVALLQHFTMHQVVAHELTRTGGKLRSVGLLTGLASQFGEATGCNGPLRSALDLLRSEQQAIDERREVKVATLQDAVEAHDRGQFLVAAVFDAFITIYERRTADLFEIARCEPGDPRLPDKLVDRLAGEVGKIANSFLNICVRGLDYLPPGTTTFGDYLRAIITADIDLVPDDPLSYRVALAESFRKREIPVEGCMSYAPSSLEWAVPDLSGFAGLDDPGQQETKKRGPDLLFSSALRSMKLFAQLNDKSGRRADAAGGTGYFDLPVSERNLRDEAMRVVEYNQGVLHQWLASPSPSLAQERMWEKLLGVRTLPLAASAKLGKMGQPRSIRTRKTSVADMASKLTGWASAAEVEALLREAFGGAVPDEFELPVFDVNSVRISRRIGPTGTELFQMFVQVTQRRAGFYDRKLQAEYDSGARSLHDKDKSGKPVRPDFWFRGGATIIVDLRNGSVQRVVSQRIDNDARLNRQRDFVLGDDTALTMAGISARGGDDDGAASSFAFEPFAFVHSDLS